MRKKNSKKKVVLIALIALALCMGIGYSILSQSLKIEGTVSVDNGFNVVITGIEKYDNKGTNEYSGMGSGTGNVPGTVVELEQPSYTATTANFNVKLGIDTEISYLVTVENKGNLAAQFDPTTINKSGLEDIAVQTPIELDNVALMPGSSFKYLVTIKYSASNDMSEETSANISITLNAKQAQNLNSAASLKPYILFGKEIYTNNGIYKTLGIDLINANIYSMGEFGTQKFLFVTIDDGEAFKVPLNGNQQENKSFFTAPSMNKLQLSLGSELTDGVATGQQHRARIKFASSSSANSMFDDSNEIVYFYYVPAV